MSPPFDYFKVIFDHPQFRENFFCLEEIAHQNFKKNKTEHPVIQEASRIVHHKIIQAQQSTDFDYFINEADLSLEFSLANNLSCEHPKLSFDLLKQDINSVHAEIKIRDNELDLRGEQLVEFQGIHLDGTASVNLSPTSLYVTPHGQLFLGAISGLLFYTHSFIDGVDIGKGCDLRAFEKDGIYVFNQSRDNPRYIPESIYQQMLGNEVPENEKLEETKLEEYQSMLIDQHGIPYPWNYKSKSFDIDYQKRKAFFETEYPQILKFKVNPWKNLSGEEGNCLVGADSVQKDRVTLNLTELIPDKLKPFLNSLGRISGNQDLATWIRIFQSLETKPSNSSGLMCSIKDEDSNITEAKQVLNNIRAELNFKDLKKFVSPYLKFENSSFKIIIAYDFENEVLDLDLDQLDLNLKPKTENSLWKWIHIKKVDEFPSGITLSNDPNQSNVFHLNSHFEVQASLDLPVLGEILLNSKIQIHAQLKTNLSGLKDNLLEVLKKSAIESLDIKIAGLEVWNKQAEILLDPVDLNVHLDHRSGKPQLTINLFGSQMNNQAQFDLTMSEKTSPKSWIDILNSLTGQIFWETDLGNLDLKIEAIPDWEKFPPYKTASSNSDLASKLSGSGTFSDFSFHNLELNLSRKNAGDLETLQVNSQVEEIKISKGPELRNLSLDGVFKILKLIDGRLAIKVPEFDFRTPSLHHDAIDIRGNIHFYLKELMGNKLELLWSPEEKAVTFCGLRAPIKIEGIEHPLIAQESHQELKSLGVSAVLSGQYHFSLVNLSGKGYLALMASQYGGIYFLDPKGKKQYFYDPKEKKKMPLALFGKSQWIVRRNSPSPYPGIYYGDYDLNTCLNMKALSAFGPQPYIRGCFKMEHDNITSPRGMALRADQYYEFILEQLTKGIILSPSDQHR